MLPITVTPVSQREILLSLVEQSVQTFEIPAEPFPTCWYDIEVPYPPFGFHVSDKDELSLTWNKVDPVSLAGRAGI